MSSPFWSRWYNLTGHFEVGPAVTVVHGSEMDLLEKQSAYVEATYYGVSDEVLANLRGKQIQYPKGFKTR